MAPPLATAEALEHDAELRRPLPATVTTRSPLQSARRWGDERLELRVGLPPLLLIGLALLIACPVVAVVLWATGSREWYVALFLVPPFLAWVIGLLAYRYMATRVTISRADRAIIVTGRWRETIREPLDELAAVQLLYIGRRAVGRSPSRRVFQLNLVLSASPPRRVLLFQCGHERRMRALAQALADFARVPLLDQASPDAWPADPR